MKCSIVILQRVPSTSASFGTHKHVHPHSLDIHLNVALGQGTVHGRVPFKPKRAQRNTRPEALYFVPQTSIKSLSYMLMVLSRSLVRTDTMNSRCLTNQAHRDERLGLFSDWLTRLKSNFLIRCGITLVISSRLMFLPMHVREPNPKGIKLAFISRSCSSVALIHLKSTYQQ